MEKDATVTEYVSQRLVLLAQWFPNLLTEKQKPVPGPKLVKIAVVDMLFSLLLLKQ